MEKGRVFKQKPDVQPANLGGELAMLNIDSGEYFVINEVGKDIWECINGIRNVSQIIEELTQVYAADSEEIADDVMHFIQELEEAKVIVEVAYE